MQTQDKLTRAAAIEYLGALRHNGNIPQDFVEGCSDWELAISFIMRFGFMVSGDIF